MGEAGMTANHPQAPDFSASLADAQCCLAILLSPDTSQADREIACLMLSTAPPRIDGYR